MNEEFNRAMLTFDLKKTKELYKKGAKFSSYFDASYLLEKSTTKDLNVLIFYLEVLSEKVHKRVLDDCFIKSLENKNTKNCRYLWLNLSLDRQYIWNKLIEHPISYSNLISFRKLCKDDLKNGDIMHSKLTVEELSFIHSLNPYKFEELYFEYIIYKAYDKSKRTWIRENMKRSFDTIREYLDIHIEKNTRELIISFLIL